MGRRKNQPASEEEFSTLPDDSSEEGSAEEAERESAIQRFLDSERIENRLRKLIARYIPRFWWYDFEVGLLLVAPAFQTDFHILELSLVASRENGAGIVDVWDHPSTFPAASQPWVFFDPERFEHAWWKATDEVREHFSSEESSVYPLSIRRGPAVRYLLDKGVPQSVFPDDVLAACEPTAGDLLPGQLLTVEPANGFSEEEVVQMLIQQRRYNEKAAKQKLRRAGIKFRTEDEAQEWVDQQAQMRFYGG